VIGSATATGGRTEPRTKLGARFWRLWWANAINSLGDGAFVAAMPLLAVTVTRDPVQIALISVAAYLPWLLMSLPAGCVRRSSRPGDADVALPSVPGPHRGLDRSRARGVDRVVRPGDNRLQGVAGGFLAQAFGVRAPFVIAGVVRAVVLVAMLPILLGELRAVQAKI